MRGYELVDCHAGLLEKADERSGLDLARVRHDAAACAATHDDVAATTTRDGESEPLERAYDLRPKHAAA